MLIEKLQQEINELREQLASKEAELALEKNAEGLWFPCEHYPDDKIKLEQYGGYTHVISRDRHGIEIEVVLNRRMAGILGRALVKFSVEAK